MSRAGTKTQRNTKGTLRESLRLCPCPANASQTGLCGEILHISLWKTSFIKLSSKNQRMKKYLLAFTLFAFAVVVYAQLKTDSVPVVKETRKVTREIPPLPPL